MERVVVLGRGGVGKTVFARRLGEVMGAPVVCLDAIRVDDLEEFRALLAEAHAGERWVSDGNFAAVSFDIRLPRATLIIWLEGSRVACSWRAFRRVFRRGEQHRIGGLVDVFKFVWRFDRVNRPRIESYRLAHGPDVPVVRLSGRRDVESFLARVSGS